MSLTWMGQTRSRDQSRNRVTVGSRRFQRSGSCRNRRLTIVQASSASPIAQKQAVMSLWKIGVDDVSPEEQQFKDKLASKGVDYRLCIQKQTNYV